jgi:hypothetical protein
MGAFSGPDINENGLVLALDAANKKSYSQNEFQYSTDIFAWCGSSGHNAVTISRDTISSPVGNSPMKMAVTGNDPHIGTYNSGTWNIAPAANAQTWIVSVYVKADVATTGQIFIFGANSAGTGFVSGAWLTIAATTFNITTEWTRVSYYATMSSASIAYIHTRLDGPDTGGTGQTIWWDGLQVERVPSGTTTPTPFTSSYYGGSVFRDLSNTNNTGTLQNTPTYTTPGHFNFDYTQLEYVSFSSSSSLQFLNRSPYTLESWVYPTRNPGANNWTGIFDREDTSIGSRDGYNLYFLGSAGSQTYFTAERFTAGTVVSTSITLDQSISVNNWHHLVVTYDGTTLSLYRNGSLVGTPATSTGNITNTSKTLTIAVRGGQYFGGIISNARIYNRSISTSEIQQNFNALRGRFGI